jgi:hypothetical protein
VKITFTQWKTFFFIQHARKNSERYVQWNFTGKTSNNGSRYTRSKHPETMGKNFGCPSLIYKIAQYVRETFQSSQGKSNYRRNLELNLTKTWRDSVSMVLVNPTFCGYFNC